MWWGKGDTGRAISARNMEGGRLIKMKLLVTLGKEEAKWSEPKADMY